MWEVLLGTAAANKAVSVGVGLSVLLGAAGTAEVTGVGPAVRDIVLPEASVPAETTDEDTESDVELKVETIEEDDAELTTEEAESNEESDDADHPQDDREHAVVDAEDAPGNLVWHLRNGSFHLRGILVEDGDGVAIRTAGPDGSTVDLPLDEELVTARLPGAKSNKPQPDAEPVDAESTESESTLVDYIGYLVAASGECTTAEGDDDAEADCTLRELHILGQAGQGDDDATSEDSEALTSESDDETDADEDDESEEEDEDDGGHGKPEHAGPKHDKPSQE